MARQLTVSLVGLFAGLGCVGPFVHRDDRDGRRITNVNWDAKRMPAAATEAALKVDTVGRKLVAGMPFLLKDEPTFQTIGSSDPELFHRDAAGLFITEGVVQLCKSEEELAAVLASELGHMSSESRRAQRMQLPDPIPAAAQSPSIQGGPEHDPARLIELADLEMHYRKPAVRKEWATTDPRTIAEECLANAGYDPKSLAKVEPILRQARRQPKLARQLRAPEQDRYWLR